VTVRAMSARNDPGHGTERPREWFSIDALAEHLEVSASTIYKWIAKDDFPAHVRLPNNQIRVHRDDLDVWMARRRVA
jgi:excisionase family DNA binding protein